MSAAAASNPKVTVGLPVYNGERYLAQAIESVLGQTYGDLVLLISDNASTDATQDICTSFAAKDSRVVYHRQPQNIGAGPNHDWVATHATGKYFKWGADDDYILPEFLERCVARLEAEPDAVLCHTRTRIAREGGDSYATHYSGLEAARPSDRFGVVILKPHWCVEQYGVIRTSALLQTELQARYYGKDKAMLAELALLGRFLHVPEPLFVNRDHPGRSMRAVRISNRARFHDPNHAGPKVTQWAQYTDYVRAVRRHVHDRDEVLRCYSKLARWWISNAHAARLSLEMAVAVAPSLAGPVFRMRDRYHDRRHGIGASQQ
jgi:glycosyltransferase involved in cell wall biosynthesis